MASNLHRFGIDDDDQPPDPRWKRAVNKLLKALVTNPRLLVGAESSDIILPDQNPAKAQRSTTAGTNVTGAFCTLYVDDDGNTMLQGGTIIGTGAETTEGTDTGSEVVPDEEVIASGASLPLADSGDHLYLQCNVTALLANGVMMPGLYLVSAELTKTLGTPHAFSTTALNGDIYIEVGRWTDTEFLPSGACGLSSVGGCPGGYTIR
jgi:hypothetical protein